MIFIRSTSFVSICKITLIHVNVKKNKAFMPVFCKIRIFSSVTDTLNCPEIANLICHDPANVRDIKCISHTQMTASLVNRDSRHLLFWVFQ